MDALSKVRVILFGVGGVGSWCAEGLVRSGIVHLTLVDSDRVAATNVNRQDMATSSTIGKVKVDALRDRLLDINPLADITPIQAIFCADTAPRFNLDSYDYVIDAIDSLKDKADLILAASASTATFYSAMGAALKIDPTAIRVAEFWNVRGCPLGAALRKKLKRAGRLPAKPFLCVYDEEVLPNRGTVEYAVDEPAAGGAPQSGSTPKAQINGSLAHITAIFGFTLSGLLLQDVYRKVNA